MPLRLLSFCLLLLGTLPPDSIAETSDTASTKQKRILFLGDSLTDGFGLDREESFPGLVEKKIELAGLSYEVINAGVSGDTSAGGLRRIDWLLRAPISILVLALGANDGLRGLPPEKTEENLLAIISKVRENNPDVKILLAGMLVPPNMGPDFESKFRAIFTSVAEEKGVYLLPFLLEGVAAEKELNFDDGIHPNEKGHKIIAENVWNALYPLLEGTIEADPLKDVARSRVGRDDVGRDNEGRQRFEQKLSPEISDEEKRKLLTGNILLQILAGARQ